MGYLEPQIVLQIARAVRSTFSSTIVPLALIRSLDGVPLASIFGIISFRGHIIVDGDIISL